MAEIYSIVYQPQPSRADDPDPKFNRVSIDSGTLIADHGLEGDRKAGRNPNRQLNLIDHETLELLRAEGFQTEPGEMGEQIIVRGAGLDKLARGTRVRLGTDAEIEITFPRTGCSWLEKIQGQSKELTIGRLGVMARVISGGQIRVGDSVRVLVKEVE